MTGYIVVAGAANIDIGARPEAALLDRDSNPGHISLDVGGVGCNIARDLALLGARVEFLAALGGDLFSAKIEGACLGDGVRLGEALRAPQERSSCYLYIDDERGDMRLAVNDMGIQTLLTPKFFAEKLALINSASALIIDANLPPESISFLAENSRVPIFADPVSAAKAPRLAAALPALNTLKPNRLEAAALTGLEITDEASLAACADLLLATGLPRVLVTLGEEGALLAAGGLRLRLAPPAARAVSMTGAGDAFLAGFIRGVLLGFPEQEAARFAMDCAACAAASPAAVAPELRGLAPKN